MSCRATWFHFAFFGQRKLFHTLTYVLPKHCVSFHIVFKSITGAFFMTSPHKLTDHFITVILLQSLQNCLWSLVAA